MVILSGVYPLSISPVIKTKPDLHLQQQQQQQQQQPQNSVILAEKSLASQHQATSRPAPPGKYPLHDACPDFWTWNFYDRSHEVRLHGNRLQTVHFHPNWSNGTAGVRGSKPLNCARHYWEIKVSQRIFGTSMMFGIGTRKARLHVDAFVNMLGEDEHSWGLSHKGLLWHKGTWKQYTKSFKENEATTIGMLFDGNEGTLTYYKDGESLGVAFSGLNSVEEELFPVVCSTAAKTEMTLGITLRTFHSLQDRCRAAIISNVHHYTEVHQLPLPNRMIAFIKDGMTL